MLDEKPTVVPVGSPGKRSGGAQEVPYGASRSNTERAAPLACVGRRFAAVRWSGIDRLDGLARRAGARAGRPRWLRILSITGGSSMAAMIFKAPPQSGQCFDVDIEDPFEQSGPTQARCLSLRLSAFLPRLSDEPLYLINTNVG